MADQVTELQQAFGATTQTPATSSGQSAATETPLGSTPGNFFGKEAAPLRAQGAANEKIGEAIKEEGENQVSRSVLGQEAAEKTGETAKANVSELQTLNDLHQAAINKELERAKPLIDAVDKYKFHEYWSDAGTGRAVLAAVASGLLGFGTGQYHNVAKELADADHARQVSEFNAMLERARMAGAGVDRLMQIQEHGLNTMTLMQAAKYKAIAAEYDRLGAQATTVEAQTAAKMGRAQFEKAAATEMQKYYQGLRTRAAKNTSQSIHQPQGKRPGD